MIQKLRKIEKRNIILYNLDFPSIVLPDVHTSVSQNIKQAKQFLFCGLHEYPFHDYVVQWYKDTIAQGLLNYFPTDVGWIFS